MRTTLMLNDELVQAAKKKAAERHTSLSALVNEALRASLKPSQGQEPRNPFKVNPFAPETMKKIDTSPEEIYDLLVAEDTEPYGS
jgi:plasmid stability protein